MTDVVERLRHHARVGDGWTRPVAAEAADEIERLRAECQRLAGEVSRAHKDALGWMERAAAARAEAARLRSAVRALLDADDYWLRGNAGNEWSHRMGIAREVARAALAKEPGHE